MWAIKAHISLHIAEHIHDVVYVLSFSTLSLLSKNFSRQDFEYFSYFSQKIVFDI